MKINFKITTQCPANCKCCNERLENFQKMQKSDKTLKELFEKIEEIFSHFQEKYLSITGGEPTLIQSLSKYVKQVSKEGIYVGIDTNGWNINKEWMKEMESAGLKYILFSVYSMNELVFEQLRGSENGQLYLRMKQAWRTLKEYKVNGGNIEVRIQMVLMKQNYRELPELLKAAIDSKFNTVSTAYYISENPNGEILMSREDINDFKNNVKPEIISIINRMKIGTELKKVNIEKVDSFFCFNNVSEDKIANGIYRNKVNCGEHNRIALYPNGDVTPCLGFDYLMDYKYVMNVFNNNEMKKIVNLEFGDFWLTEHKMCNHCSSGYQVWINLLDSE